MRTIIVLTLIALTLCAVPKKKGEEIKRKWDDFLKCVKESQILAEKYEAIVKAIHEKHYREAVKIAFELYKEGKETIIHCIRKVREINLQGWDIPSAIMCLKSIAVSAPCIASAIGSVMSGCIPCACGTIVGCGGAVQDLAMDCISPFL